MLRVPAQFQGPAFHHTQISEAIEQAIRKDKQKQEGPKTMIAHTNICKHAKIRKRLMGTTLFFDRCQASLPSGIFLIHGS